MPIFSITSNASDMTRLSILKKPAGAQRACRGRAVSAADRQLRAANRFPTARVKEGRSRGRISPRPASAASLQPDMREDTARTVRAAERCLSLASAVKCY